MLKRVFYLELREGTSNPSTNVTMNNSDCNHKTRLSFDGNNVTLLAQIVSDLKSIRL